MVLSYATSSAQMKIIEVRRPSGLKKGVAGVFVETSGQWRCPQ